MASTIMGSPETTLYTIAIYVGAVKIKNIRFVLAAALIADVVRNASFNFLLSYFVERFLLTIFYFYIIMFTVLIYSNYISLKF